MHKIEVEGGVPIYNWAEEPEAGALEQAMNLARLPDAIHHVALMPDAHQGYGMPIGGVLFTDSTVVPNAVGVDIGCGVVLLETDRSIHEIDTSKVKLFLDQVHRDVPVGNGPGGGHRTSRGEPFEAPGASALAQQAIIEADLQLGSLGGGNHFLELQVDEDGQLWFMIHSGSRSVGKKICDHHHRIAQDLCERAGLYVPHPELAYLPMDSDEGMAYWFDMNAALAWAEENRARMAGAVISAFGKVFDGKMWQVLDVHHNYATMEEHLGVTGVIHRKGSVRARNMEPVLIPGSMSTGSYLALGLGNKDSFETCQHGAGRARSRGATRRLVTLATMERQLLDADVVLVTPSREKVIDESQLAYKDIESVMAASVDLVTATRVHRPVGVVKG